MEKPKVRIPAVAGQFYPSSASGIKNQISAFIDKRIDKRDVIACMLPHAGYMYSGAVAAKTASRVNIKEKIILFGPNHTGCGAEFSIMTEGIWQTPLGEINIDNALAKKMLSASTYLKEDALAHLHEHSLEVELPILQYFKTDFEIVPIAIRSSDLRALKKIGSQVAAVIKDLGIKDSVLLVASSDMTHYEPFLEAQRKDKEAIRAILELNEDALYDRVRSLNISMCGHASATVMLSCAKALGATGAELVKYQTSGDITGDNDSVVGYAGIIIY